MAQKQIEISSFLPLTPASFQILLALSDGEKHGYAIMREVAHRAENRLPLGPATLYGSIRRLLEDGLIAESSERPDPALDDQRRRYYRLTNTGRRVAEAEAQRLADLVRTARAKNLLHRPGTI
jgi:DNA-binding PadR family transcriptional regulator